MIPDDRDRDGGGDGGGDDLPPAPLAAGTAVVLASAAGLLQLMVTITLLGFGIAPGYAVVGMSAVLTYGALLAMLAPRLPEPAEVELGFVPSAWSGWIASGLLVASVLLTSELDNVLRALFPPAEIEVSNLDPHPEVSLGELLLVQVIVLPLVFELFFRGALQPTLERALGAGRGVVLSAALGGLAYAMGLPNPRALPIEFANGLVAGSLRHITGSLKPVLLFAGGLGAVRVAAHYQAFEIAGFDDLRAAHTPTHWLMYSAAITAAGLWLLRRAARDAAALRAAAAAEAEAEDKAEDEAEVQTKDLD